MAETLKPEEKYANWKAPENSIAMDPEEEARLAIENQETKRKRFKEAFQAFNLELGASSTMFYELTPDERDEMMQKMLDIHKYYRDLAYQNAEKRRKGGIDHMNDRPR